MRYRWIKRGEDDWDEAHALYLILDGKKYEFGQINWGEVFERWDLFISGFACEETLDIEKERYELLCDAKNILLNYARVWYVTGTFQRMSDDEKKSWWELGS